MPRPKELTTLEKIKALEALFKIKDETRSRTLQTVADKLGSELMPPRAWSAAYLHQVISGKLKPSRFLVKATNRLYAFIYKQSAINTSPENELTDHNGRPLRKRTNKIPDTFIPFKNKAERARAMRLIPPAKRRALLMAYISKR